MRSLRKTQPAFGIDLADAPEPRAPGAGEVRVRVEHAGICGSDVHAYEWSDGYGFMGPRLPLIMGHEFAGSIDAVGSGTPWAVGDRVVIMPGITCGVCEPCRREDTRGCLQRETIGLTVDGGFARHVVVPSGNCVALPANVDTEVGALIEPLCVGAEGVLVGEVSLGETVLVMGPGTIGQALALMARAAGAARVIISGRADAPRFDVLRALGFDQLVDVADGPLKDQVLALTGGRPVDVVLEAAGVPSTINDGLSVLRKDGRLVVVGIHAAPLTLALTQFVRMRHQLRASHGASRATWDRTLALMARDPEVFRPMITHRLPLDRGVEAFELARQRTASKVMLEP